MKEALTSWLLEFLAITLRIIPDFMRNQVLKWMGWIYANLHKEHRQALEFNHRLLFQLKGSPLTQRAVEVCQNFAITLFDFSNPEGIQVDVPRKEHLEAWRAQYGSLMLLTFHMGLWEMGARILGRWQWPVTAVYQAYKNKRLKRTIEKRRAPGVNFIPVGKGAAKAVNEALRGGNLVAMLGDQAFGEDGISVALLGHRVKWAKGPILLSVKEKVPIIVTVVIRTGHRSYRVIIGDPLIPQEKSTEEIQRLAQAIANKFGNLLKTYPTQWYYFRPLELASLRDQSELEPKGISELAANR